MVSPQTRFDASDATAEDSQFQIDLRKKATADAEMLGLGDIASAAERRCYFAIVKAWRKAPANLQDAFMSRFYADLPNRDDFVATYRNLGAMPNANVVPHVSVKSVAAEFQRREGLPLLPVRVRLPNKSDGENGIFRIRTSLDDYASAAEEAGRLNMLFHIWNLLGQAEASKLERMAMKFSKNGLPGDPKDELVYDRLVAILRAGLAELLLKDIRKPTGNSLLLGLLESGYAPIGEHAGSFDFADVR